jgi:hypothetical protein
VGLFFYQMLGLRTNNASLKTSRMSKSYWTNDFVKFNKNITGFIIRLPKNCEQTNI